MKMTLRPRSFQMRSIAVATLLLGFFGSGSWLQSDDREEGGHDRGGGGGVGVSIDLTSIFSALTSSGEKKKKDTSHTPGPEKKANDSDCPERYKALLALLAKLKPVVDQLAQAIQGRNDALAAVEQAREAWVEANTELLNAQMEALRHKGDADAAQAAAEAKKAVDQAKAAFDKAQAELEAAQNYVAYCADKYNKAEDQYDDALKAYNAHCRDYKPGPPFPPTPANGKVTPPSAPEPPPDVYVPASPQGLSTPEPVPPPPGGSKPGTTPGGQTNKPGGGSSKPDDETNKPGSNNKPGDDNGKTGSNTNKPGSDNGKTDGHTTKPGGDASKPGGDGNTPGGDGGTTGGDGARIPPPTPPPGNAPGPTPPGTNVAPDDCVQLYNKLLADMQALQTLFYLIIDVEDALQEDYEDWDDLMMDYGSLFVLSVLTGGHDPDIEPKFDAAVVDMKLLETRIAHDEARLAGLQAEANDLLTTVTQEAAEYRRHCGKTVTLPMWPGLLRNLPFGTAAVYAGHPLDAAATDLLHKTQTAQEEAYLKRQNLWNALHEAEAAHHQVKKYDQPVNDALSHLSDSKPGSDRTEEALKKAQQARDDRTKSPDYAKAQDEAKARDTAAKDAAKACKEADKAFEILLVQYKKQVGHYPYEEQVTELEKKHGAINPGPLPSKPATTTIDKATPPSTVPDKEEPRANEEHRSWTWLEFLLPALVLMTVLIYVLKRFYPKEYIDRVLVNLPDDDVTEEPTDDSYDDSSYDDSNRDTTETGDWPKVPPVSVPPFLPRTGENPCDELIRLCEEARARAKASADAAAAARAAADQARADCEKARAATAAAQQALDQAQTPPSEGSSWIEDEQGNRITSHDLDLERQAATEARGRYARGEISAQDLEDELSKWGPEQGPAAMAARRAKEAQERAQKIADAQAKLDAAKKAQDEICGKVGLAEVKAEDAEADAKYDQQAADAICDEAKDCVRKRDEPKPPTPPAPDPGGKSTPGDPTPGSPPGGGGTTPPPTPPSGGGATTYVPRKRNSCCGKQFDEVYVECLNRVVERLRFLMPAEASLGTFGRIKSGLVFLSQNGWQIDFFADWDCPENNDMKCHGTVTIGGKCHPFHILSDFLYGFIAGYFGLGQTGTSLGGIAFKLVQYYLGVAKHPLQTRENTEPLPPLHWSESQPAYRAGARLGARQYGLFNPTTVTVEDLKFDPEGTALADIAVIASDSCHPCDEVATPKDVMKDFSRVAWSFPLSPLNPGLDEQPGPGSNPNK